MKQIILVFLGGGVGSILRYVISLLFISNDSVFPKATFIVNLIGSLLIGLLIGYQLKFQSSNVLSLLFITGFCGGFTTFSTFSLVAYSLYKAEEWSNLCLYLGLSISLGIILVGIGVALFQKH